MRLSKTPSCSTSRPACQPPLKSVDEIKDTPDAILAEAAQITADYVRLQPTYVAGTKPGG